MVRHVSCSGRNKISFNTFYVPAGTKFWTTLLRSTSQAVQARLGAVRCTTEELLYVLLWGAETLARPTFRNVTESFEGWAYRRGILRHLHELEQRKFIERRSATASDSVERICRLTEIGRMAALGGCDPEQRWNRPWDGTWRMVTFDLPEIRNTARVRLRRYLRERGFGYLQHSVWITPDPVEEEIRNLSSEGEDVETFLTWEARPGSGVRDASIVRGSWDFERIRETHEECLRLLKNPPWGKNGQARDPNGLRKWASEERAAWEASVAMDPFLPGRLLPKGYLGRKVWQLRSTVLREAGASLPQMTQSMFGREPESRRTVSGSGRNKVSS